MQISRFFFVGSVAIPTLALVPGTRHAEPRSLSTDGKSTLLSRGPEVLGGIFRKRSQIQYDNYLPELPAEWPNITISHDVRRSRGSETKDELAIRARGDVAIRDDPGDFARYLFMGLKIYAVAAGPVTWYGLVESCQQFTQEAGNGVQCVFGAITQLIAVVTLVYQGAVWRGQLATTLTNNGWHVPGINKRDEWIGNMIRDLSDGLKTEVRHLGSWSGPMTDQKRDSEPAVLREVFGVKTGDQDFHFTYMGRDAGGKDSFKVGLGDGSGFPTDNVRRQGSQYTDGNFYFTSGGIDFAGQSVEPSSATEWSWGSTSDGIEFSDIENSVNCYLNQLFYIDLIENNALAFQVYDAFVDGTFSAGVMSPFSATQKSAIQSLTIGGGLGTSSCATF